MRKLKTTVATICLLAVAVGSSYANVRKDQILKVEQTKQLLELDQYSAKKDGGQKFNPGYTLDPSAAYSQGSHGTTHRRWDTEQISYDPTTGLYGTVFDLKTTAGLRSLGGMASVWGEGNESNMLNGSDQTGIWYANADVTGIDDYVVALLPQTGATGPWLKLSVYKHSEQSWSEHFTVEAPNGAKPEKVNHAHGSMTKDNNGNYYIMITTGHKMVGYNDREQSVIVGKTTDPFNGPWTFSDFNQVLVKTAATGAQFSETVCDFRGAWGKNGFGIAVMGGDQAADTSKHGIMAYTWTTNYGQTWNKADDATGFLHIIPMDQDMFPWVGTMSSGAEPIEIPRTSIGNNLDIVVDDNNDVHIVDFIWAGAAGTSYYPNMWQNGTGVFVNGYYHITRKFTDAGAPEEAKWRANYIAQTVGRLDEDTPDGSSEYIIEKKYSNTKYARISDGGNGYLVAQWIDRPRGKNIVSGDDFGTLVGIPEQTHSHDFVPNPYLSVSIDNGLTWSLAVNNDSAKVAYEVKTYSDPKISELGFSIPSKSKVITNPNAISFETYATYGIPILESPSPAAAVAPSAPGTAPHRFEQNWHIMKIMINGDGGIETEVTALTKNFTMSQNYPNPFNPTTSINFNLNNASNVKLSVYNAKGQEVSELINAKMTSGTHTANFNAANLNSGVYFYKLTVDGQSAVKKMVLTK